MLASLFSRRRPTPPAAAPVFWPIERPDAVPTLSDTVVRAVACATDPDATLADIAALARRDAAVTAVLLKRASSAACGGAPQEVGQAVVWLGMRTCTQVIAAIGLRDVLRDYPPEVRERAEAILRHSLFVANVVSHLNRQLRLGFGGEEFTGGLLHDIGRVILSARSPAAVELADPLDFDETPGSLARERAALGVDHCAVGATFAKRNGLPAAVVPVILRHHRPDDEWEYRRLVGLVATADDLANHVQRFRALRRYKPENGGGYVVLSERWDSDRHAQFRAVVPGALRAALRDTRGTLRGFSV